MSRASNLLSSIGFKHRSSEFTHPQGMRATVDHQDNVQLQHDSGTQVKVPGNHKRLKTVLKWAIRMADPLR